MAQRELALTLEQLDCALRRVGAPAAGLRFKTQDVIAAGFAGQTHGEDVIVSSRRRYVGGQQRPIQVHLHTADFVAYGVAQHCREAWGDRFTLREAGGGALPGVLLTRDMHIECGPGGRSRPVNVEDLAGCRADDDSLARHGPCGRCHGFDPGRRFIFKIVSLHLKRVTGEPLRARQSQRCRRHVDLIPVACGCIIAPDQLPIQEERHTVYAGDTACHVGIERPKFIISGVVWQDAHGAKPYWIGAQSGGLEERAAAVRGIARCVGDGDAVIVRAGGLETGEDDLMARLIRAVGD